MALPTLDAVFASAADQPRRYMLSQWLVGEKEEVAGPSSVLVSGLDAEYNGFYAYDGDINGRPSYRLNEDVDLNWGGDSWNFSDAESGAGAGSASDVPYPWLATDWYGDGGINPENLVITEIPAANPIADYITLPERYLWAKIAVAAGAPLDEASYISLPKQYVWKAIYDSVSGSSLGTIDWSEKQALGNIAAAYRGDTGNPANLATYIDWPWRYQVASIIGQLTIPSGPIFPSDGLLAFWKLEDESDSSGNGNTLTNTNNVTFGAGKIGNAAIINNNYLSSNWEQDFSEDWSISVWFKRPTGDTLPTIIDLSPTVGFPILDIRDNNRVNFNDASVELISGPWTPDEWTHVVLSSNSGTVTMYVQNNEEGSISWSGTTSTLLKIGDAQGSSPRYFNGEIDALGIWGRSLNQAEIENLYNAGNGLEIS
jgi:hypothetical protein